ncbi:MAG: PA0069 family radical SAM protein [Geminicoccaceae bacterium]
MIRGGHKGRGATLNPEGRFERQAREVVDDGWGGLDELAAAPGPATTVTPDTSRSIIARNDSPDIGFDQSINPYRGCEHGCIYCYARPSHSWLGLSAGLDFETRLFAKHDAAALLRRELARPGYVPKTLALGANTDPYQPVEGRLGITRGVLQVLAEARHPVGIVTKSARVLRDLDLLRDLAADGLVRVDVSVTSLDAELSRRMEPRASAPSLRLRAIERLAAAGVPTGANLAPMIPGINDHEMERLVAAVAAAGAMSASWILVRLPFEVKDLFEAWLAEHFPDRAERVLSLIRQCRDGRLNDPEFGSRMRGSGPVADLLRTRFAAACRRHRLQGRFRPLRTDLFRPPRADGQLSLF